MGAVRRLNSATRRRLEYGLQDLFAVRGRESEEGKIEGENHHIHDCGQLGERGKKGNSRRTSTFTCSDILDFRVLREHICLELNTS
jgi:hypothetical protein